MKNLKDILNDMLIVIKNGDNDYMCNALLRLKVPFKKQIKIRDILWKHRVKSKLMIENSKIPAEGIAWYPCHERKTRILNIKRAIKSLDI